MGLPPEEERLVRNFCDHPYVKEALANPDINVRLVGANGEYLYVGPGTETLVGFTPDHLIHIDAWSLVHPEEKDVIRAMIEETLQGNAVELVARALQKDGNYRWVRNWVQPFGRHLASFGSATATPPGRKAYCRPLHPFMDSGDGPVNPAWASNRSQQPTSQPTQ